MSATPQSFEHHAMYQPSWHYWALPTAFIYLVYCLVTLVRGGIAAHEVFDLIGAVAQIAAIRETAPMRSKTSWAAIPPRTRVTRQ